MDIGFLKKKKVEMLHDQRRKSWPFMKKNSSHGENTRIWFVITCVCVGYLRARCGARPHSHDSSQARLALQRRKNFSLDSPPPTTFSPLITVETEKLSSDGTVQTFEK